MITQARQERRQKSTTPDPKGVGTGSKKKSNHRVGGEPKEQVCSLEVEGFLKGEAIWSSHIVAH